MGSASVKPDLRQRDDMVRILIVEDHPLFLDALRGAVAAAFDAELLSATTMEQALLVVDLGAKLDLVLLDLKVPDTGLFQGLIAIKRRRPDLRVLVVSALLSRAVVVEALKHGAAGFIPKSSPAREITAAINCVLSGDIFLPETYRGCERSCDGDNGEATLLKALSSLSEQQRRVLGLINKGKLNKQIAHDLGIAERTVKAHITEILRKLQVNSRTQAALASARLKELQLLD